VADKHSIARVDRMTACLDAVSAEMNRVYGGKLHMEAVGEVAVACGMLLGELIANGKYPEEAIAPVLRVMEKQCIDQFRKMRPAGNA